LTSLNVKVTLLAFEYAALTSGTAAPIAPSAAERIFSPIDSFSSLVF
jgi:hypothetical protein